MKKVVCITLAIVFCLVTIPVMAATFKLETHKAIIDKMQEYFAAEQGNKISRFSMQTLIDEINDIFQKNIIIPLQPDPKEEKDGPPDK